MFGDQNLFCRRTDFNRVNGYNAELPIMEDLDLLMRLHSAGPDFRPESSLQSLPNEVDRDQASDIKSGAHKLNIPEQKDPGMTQRVNHSSFPKPEKITQEGLASNFQPEQQFGLSQNEQHKNDISLPGQVSQQTGSAWMQNLGPIGMTTQVRCVTTCSK